MKHRRLARVTVDHMKLLRSEGLSFERIAAVVGRSVSVVHRALCGYTGSWSVR